MSRWCLALTVPGELGVAIDALRHTLDPGRVHMPAHITVVAPWTAHDITAELETVAAVCADTAPWPVHLQGGGSFRPHSATEFIAVREGGERVAMLHERLMGAVSRGAEGRPFHPHVTVANRCSNEVLDEARRLTAGFDAWFSVASVTVFEWTRDALPPRWTASHVIQLAGSASP